MDDKTVEFFSSLVSYYVWFWIGFLIFFSLRDTNKNIFWRKLRANKNVRRSVAYYTPEDIKEIDNRTTLCRINNACTCTLCVQSLSEEERDYVLILQLCLWQRLRGFWVCVCVCEWVSVCMYENKFFISTFFIHFSIHIMYTYSICICLWNFAYIYNFEILSIYLSIYSYVSVNLIVIMIFICLKTILFYFISVIFEKIKHWKLKT